MACDYKDLSEEQMDDIIHRYIHHKMSEDEEIEFASHLVECESCNEKVNKMRDLTMNAKLYFVHEQLETALKDKDLDKAIDLAAEMEVLGYSEEVYPINEKIKALKYELTDYEIEKLIDKGDDFIIKKEFGKALDCYKEAHNISSDNIEPKVGMGAVYRLLGNLNESEKILLECEQAEPDDSSTLEELGLLYMSIGKFAEAENWFEKAYELDPCHSNAVNLSLAYLELGKSQEAEKLLEPVVKFDDPEFIKLLGRPFYEPFALSALARAYYGTGKVEKAEEIVKKTLELYPDDVDTLDNISKIYIQQGRLDKSLQYYEKAMKIDPDLPHILNNIAFCYHQKIDLDKATQYIEMAVKSAPNDFTINYNNKIIKNRKKEKPRLYFYYPTIAKAA